LLLLQMMQISVSLAPLGHFHFMECSIPPTPQDLYSVIGDIFVPFIHWILFAISFAELFLESLDVDKSSSQGELLLHPISFHLFLCHPLFAELLSETLVLMLSKQSTGSGKH